MIHVCDAGTCRKAFIPIHPPNVLSHLPPEAHLGPIDPETLPKEAFEASEEEERIAKARAELPEPSAALNLHDIEVCPCVVLAYICAGR
jgi:L-lactate dehydrogenase (cytochrome)